MSVACTRCGGESSAYWNGSAAECPKCHVEALIRRMIAHMRVLPREHQRRVVEELTEAFGAD